MDAPLQDLFSTCKNRGAGFRKGESDEAAGM